MAKSLILCAALVVSGCFTDPSGDPGQVSLPPPTGNCMCVSFCGGQIEEETYWIDALGQRHKIEACLSQPLHDELVYELAAKCQCSRYTQERPL